MDWKTRLARLLEQEALERDTEARFYLYWIRTSTRSFEALPLAGTFMGRVTPDMIAELEAQDFTAYLERSSGASPGQAAVARLRAQPPSAKLRWH